MQFYGAIKVNEGNRIAIVYCTKLFAVCDYLQLYTGNVGN